MSPGIDERLLLGTWIHAHEEDTPGQAVFRGPTFPCRRARGRKGYQFLPGGKVIRMQSGAVDRAVSAEGTSASEPTGRVIVKLPGQPDKQLDVISVDADRLVVKT